MSYHIPIPSVLRFLSETAIQIAPVPKAPPAFQMYPASCDYLKLFDSCFQFHFYYMGIRQKCQNNDNRYIAIK